MDVKIQNLYKQYHSHAVLNGIETEIHPNEIIGLLGPNGCGKSTLLKCINDLVSYNQGTILFDNEKRNPSVNDKIAYLPEQSALAPAWKGKDAISFYADFYSDFDREKALKLIKEMNLNLNQEIKNMSKGMQEKLQLALVMSRKAELYILDEPLSGVDPASRDKILNTILTNFEPGSSLLITTHLVADIEQIFDRVLIMKNGKIFVDENADALREKEQMSIDAFFRKEMA